MIVSNGCRDKEQTTAQDLSMPGKKHHYLIIKVHHAQDIMYTDQIGQFSLISTHGNKYPMVMCELDRNIVDRDPMKDRA